MPLKSKDSAIKIQPAASTPEEPALKGKTLFTPSKELSAIIGAEATTRNSALSKIWSYVKENKLQDKKDGRRIKADSKLQPLFKQDTLSMFKLTGVLAQHLVKR